MSVISVPNIAFSSVIENARIGKDTQCYFLGEKCPETNDFLVDTLVYPFQNGDGK